ncbi:GntR family transcriptional regulator [Microbacterium enclense]|uniref:GntR family transcriptional regulator n=1 Tax=Microbacterium enclense TaxID=993073 RepID=UPI0021A381B4|nr:GntR family transcriptional regulator [Microbacterium enclense]MCT2085156.1 GntR family transcriptional regulator [Microbacterium enclense]
MSASELADERLDVPLERERLLRDRVEARLLAAITSGRMRSGQLYSAPTLADQLGVSATPVREAMVNLSRRGLVIVEQRKGFRVVDVTPDELRQSIVLREILEGGAMARLAGALPVADSEELYDQADEIVATADAGDIENYLTVDRRFHLRLLGYLRNPRLTEIVGDLRLTTRLVGISSRVGTEEFHASNREHRELLDHLYAGRADQARSLMEKHVRHSLGVWAGVDEAE